MGKVIKMMAELVNLGHDMIQLILSIIGVQVSDKSLHFIIFGIIGMIMFLIVDITFKWISKWSITAISFIYTFTFLAIFALSVEIQQKITGRGNMEFNDIVAGILGFVTLFGAYAFVRLCIVFGKKAYYKRKNIDSNK
ncbi:VanZ family protein [Sporosalibacterium faouarense]|uniref:VanZ family protein n=1 Tax=Sporosalibacterium faouarense TaxID=516123 RepID=UPI00192CA088|nr:VanZ family protein [Sporosalibacterium faouarense]